MSTPTPVPAPAVPWYQSPVQIAQVSTLISAAIALYPKAGNLLGLSTPADVETAVTTIFGTIALVAPIIGTFLRAKSKLQPLTLTQAAADAHPANVAAKAATVDPAHPWGIDLSKPKDTTK
jgi:hypothetical protein